MKVKPVGDAGPIHFQLGGPADGALVEGWLERTNERFNGAEINSAFTFAVSYLTSLIVIYEAHVLGCRPGTFDFDALTEQMREAVIEGHKLPARKPQ